MNARGASVEIDAISKRYGGVAALDRVSLSVREGEFLALLGPSGSGKSTMLMALAGFETPDSGSISVGGRHIDKLPPHQRDIGMVFQRYALFPHMSVHENVAYPLHRRGVKSAEIQRRVRDALALVKLEGFAARAVDQLSGGQQQRVALARALIFRPAVLLMDEPMSALDRKLREQMQMELKQLHRQVGTTIILVTHDQEEALSMADRVALLHNGRLRQLDTPQRMYRHPADAFVADFIGRTNFLPIATTGTSGTLAAPGTAHIQGFAEPCRDVLAEDAATPQAGKYLGVRPEDVHLLPGDADTGQPCTIIETAFSGAMLSILVEAGGHTLTVQAPAQQHLWQPGDRATLRFSAGSCRVFDSNQ